MGDERITGLDDTELGMSQAQAYQFRRHLQVPLGGGISSQDYVLLMVKAAPLEPLFLCPAIAAGSRSHGANSESVGAASSRDCSR